MARSEDLGFAAMALMIAALVGIVAVGLPLLQSAREQARRAKLQNNLTNNSGARVNSIDPRNRIE